MHAWVAQNVTFFNQLVCRELLLSRAESGAMAATLIVVALYKAFLNTSGRVANGDVFVRGCLFARGNILARICAPYRVPDAPCAM